jgi:hypothetical protein
VLGFITGVLLYFIFASSTAVMALGFASYLASLVGISVEIYGLFIAVGIIILFSGNVYIIASISNFAFYSHISL